MNTEKALNMVEQYILSDCTDREWRKCLQHLKWLVVHQKELLDSLAKENEYLQDEAKALIAGQETLQKYHHDATEIAYKNGYKAGVRELAERFKKYANEIPQHYQRMLLGCDVDTIAKELIGGADK